MSARRATVALDALPFYRERLDARGRPAPWSLDELADFARASGDPYGGRLARPAPPELSLQIEASEDEPVWLGLSRSELVAWSRALESMWRRFGIARGETIALFDYGSSPLVLLASGSYCAYLGRGAADRLGAATICNDGVATLAGRMLEILACVRPAALVLRRDVLAPLADALQTAGLELARGVRWIAIADADGAPSREEAARQRALWGVPVHRVLRADAAFLIAGSDEGGDAFLLDASLYSVERLPGSELAVTAHFARTCPARRYALGRGRAARSADGALWRVELA